MADGRKIISTTSIVSFIIRYGMLRNGPWLGHPFRHPTKWPDRSGTGLDWPGRTWTLGLGLGFGFGLGLGLTRTSIGHKWDNL